MLVEDDPDDATVAMRAFARNGMAQHVMLVNDGAEAYEYLLGEDAALNGARRLVPRVIFLDLKMPKLGGLDLLEQLRSNDRTRSVPVVIVTSSDLEADVKEAYRRGANSFFVKKFDSENPGKYLVALAHYWLDFNREVR